MAALDDISEAEDIQLVVFDLDYTLWDCGTWVDCTTPPFEKDDSGKIMDQAGNHCRLYPDVLEILDHVDAKGIPMALASRTHDPEAARSLLALMGIADRFKFQQIYPGSKLVHFEVLHRDSGIPYNRMVFFDDEMRNIQETGSLGVRAVHVEAGLTWDVTDVLKA